MISSKYQIQNIINKIDMLFYLKYAFRSGYKTPRGQANAKNLSRALLELYIK